jgi:hypothetical protein
MKKEKFHFTELQRQTLIEGIFKKRGADRAGKFLDRCEDAIAEWRKDWPVKTTIDSKRDVRNGLKKLATQLNKLGCSIRVLPEGARGAIWANWNRIHGLPISDLWETEQDALSLFAEIENLVLDVQGDISCVGGISKQCEADLITELAYVYAWTFHKLPSAAPNGVFMNFVGELVGIITRTDGKPFVAGKDLVATAIKRKSALREYHLLYPVD